MHYSKGLHTLHSLCKRSPTIIKGHQHKKTNYISVDDEGKLCTSDLHIVLSFTMTKEFICNCIFSFLAIMQFGLTFHYCF